MTDTLTPPEGQNSFSGIPTAEFVEDVDSYMKGEENVDEKMKVSFIKTTPSFISASTNIDLLTSHRRSESFELFYH